MKSDTIATALEALREREYALSAFYDAAPEAMDERERVRAAIADLEAATQAEPPAMPQDGAQEGVRWEPLPDGMYKAEDESANLWSTAIDIDGDLIEVSNTGFRLRPDYRLCRSKPAMPAPDHSIRVCNNAECNWIGYNCDTVRLDGVGGGIASLCPDCHETTEELTPSWVRELMDAAPATGVDVPYQVKSAIGDVWGFVYANASPDDLEKAARLLMAWLHEETQHQEPQPAPEGDVCDFCGGGRLLELRVLIDQKLLVDCVCQQPIGDLAKEIFAAGYKRAIDNKQPAPEGVTLDVDIDEWNRKTEEVLKEFGHYVIDAFVEYRDKDYQSDYAARYAIADCIGGTLAELAKVDRMERTATPQPAPEGVTPYNAVLTVLELAKLFQNEHVDQGTGWANADIDQVDAWLKAQRPPASQPQG